MACHAFHAALILASEGGRALVITDLDLIRAARRSDLDRTAADAADLAHLLVAEPGSAWRSGVLASFDVRAVVGGRDPALTRSIRPGPARRS